MEVLRRLQTDKKITLLIPFGGFAREIDVRSLNQVTKTDNYPLPCIDETIDMVVGSPWFSSLDLQSGYWQVPLSSKAIPKTAFITSHHL